MAGCSRLLETGKSRQGQRGRRAGGLTRCFRALALSCTPYRYAPRCGVLPLQVYFLSANKRLHRLGNSSRALWVELRKCLNSPQEAELFGLWLRPKAHLVQRLGLNFAIDFEAGPEEQRQWEAAQHFLRGCIAGSTSLRGLALWSDEGELRADTWCASLPRLRWA